MLIGHLLLMGLMIEVKGGQGLGHRFENKWYQTLAEVLVSW